MPTLRELGEAEVLRRMIAALPAGDGLSVGPGDDAAVLRPAAGRELVATTDCFVEGRHFLAEWSTPAERGARLALANLSDLAAMAASPRWALLSCGLRPEHEWESLAAFQHGASRTLAAQGAALVGGNLCAVDGPEWFDMTLLGEVAPGQAWTRRGARPGDLLAVTGSPGRAGAAAALARRLGAAARGAEWKSLLAAWLKPESRVGLAAALAATGAVRAAIDVSDGVRGDLGRLAEASGVRIEVDEAAWPADPLLERAAEHLGAPLELLRFGPSDDYELLIVVDPDGRQACARAAASVGAPLSWVGRFTEGRDLVLLDAAGNARPLPGAGFDHFGGG